MNLFKGPNEQTKFRGTIIQQPLLKGLNPLINPHLLLINDPLTHHQILDQIFGQGFDQGSGEGKNHEYSETSKTFPFFC